jgi:sporulation protein YlmC with PRC-barrel domain
MKRSIKSLIGFTIHATDGEIGKVKEFYFDDDTWTIRYLVVDTGNWLMGRVVLISTEALLSPDWVNETFPTNLNKEQIKNNPGISTEVTVSRQEEIKLHAHYQWVSYWGAGYYGTGPNTDLEQIALDQSEGKEDKSTHTVTGYNIEAIDGKIGDVDDFLVDESWIIAFVVVDTGHLFPGRKVLIGADMIEEVDWGTEMVILDTTVTHVKKSPEYDSNQELTEVYTLALHDHYNSPTSRNR